MKQWKIIVAVIITAILVGGGVYLWQQNESPTNSDSTFEIADLSFTLPTGWNLKEITTEQYNKNNWEVASIEVPDPQYHVVQTMGIATATETINQYEKDGYLDELIKEVSPDVKIYNNVCAPGVCYYLIYKDKIYDVVFSPAKSDQPVPENLDGLWFADTTITRDDFINLLSTVKGLD